MVKTIRVVDGFGLAEPRKVAVGPDETVEQFKKRASKAMDLEPKEIDISTEDRVLEDHEKIADAVTVKKDIVFVQPRAEGY